MERHVDLLGILANLWGALAMLVGVALLLLAMGAIAALFEPGASSVEFAAGLTAAVFSFIGVFALVWGCAHVWAAALLKKRQPLGRIVTLALAMVNLLVLPFGTAFGGYALWVLLREDGRRLFDAHSKIVG